MFNFFKKKTKIIKEDNGNYLFTGAMKSSDDSDIRSASGANIGNWVVGEYTPLTIKHSSYTFFDAFSKGKTPQEINEKYSHLIIIATNWFANYMKNVNHAKLVKWIKKIEIPITLLGLGAEAPLNKFDPKRYLRQLPKDLIKFYRTISEMSPSISVRGEITQELLNLAGIKNTRVTGCPSWFVNGENNPEINKKYYDENFKISFGTDFSSTYQNTYNEMFKKLLFEKNSQFIIQSEFKLIDYIARYAPPPYTRNLADLEDVLESLKLDRKYFPEDYNKFIYFNSIKDWQNYIKTIDFSINMRIHGTIIALKNGTPAVIIPHGSRTKEMADLFKIPQISFENFIKDNYNIKRIYEEADFEPMNKAYPKLLENYREFLKEHNLIPSERIMVNDMINASIYPSGKKSSL